VTMDLAVVSSYFPLPADRGDPVRVLMMLRAIAGTTPYTLFVVRRPDTTEARVAELRDLLPGVEVRAFEATPYRFGRLGPTGRYPEAAVAGMPPWVRTRYSVALHRELRARTGAAIGIGEAVGAYFAGTGLRWHWDKVNVLAASTRQDLAEATGAAYRLRARYLVRISRAFERRALNLASTVSVTSTAEAARLVARYRRRPDFTLPSCVPLPTGHQPRPGPRRLVWLGTFGYRPNRLGLERFLDQGWPVLERAGYSLTLIGSGLTDPVRAELARHPGVRVLGYVDDLRSGLAGARAAVVPLWSGAGVKLKTLTLLAHGVPVFTTPTGAEGLPVTPAVRVADTPQALADAVLHADARELDAMAVEARRLVGDEYSAERFTGELVSLLARHGYLGVRT
jgi:glycosyltransferase involved in cell wall biosynthesis